MTDREKITEAAPEERRLAFARFSTRMGKHYEILEREAPGWLTKGRGGAILSEALASLRLYLDDPDAPEDAWGELYVEIQFPVGLAWDLGKKTEDINASLLAQDLDLDSNPEKSSALRDPESFFRQLANEPPEWVTYSMLSRMTHEIRYVKRGADYAPNLPAKVRAILNGLPPEEASASLDEILDPFCVRSRSLCDYGPVMVISGTAGGRSFEASLVLFVLPLVLDEDEHRAYFPFQIGLLFDGEAEVPTTWPVEHRKRFWDGFLECLKPRDAEVGAEPTPTPPIAAAKPPTRYLLEGRTRRNKPAGALVGHLERLALPRRWGSIRRLDELVKEEIDRRLAEFGEDAFVDIRNRTGDPNARGALLKRHHTPDGKEVIELTKDGEEALMASVGHRGFRQVVRDADGARREYLVKRFRAGGGFLEARLSWYGMAWPLVDEGREKAEQEAEGLQTRLRQASLFENLDREDQEALDSRLRLLGSIRDARRVIDAILDRFGRDGENPLRYPAWELRVLLECERDPDGFRRVRGCLRALQEVRFALEARGAGSGSFRRFGPFLGEVSYVPRGPGEHTDGDFYLSLQEGAVGCLKVFGTSDYRIRDAHRVLIYDWGRKLEKDGRKTLAEEGFVKGFSALGAYYDVAKGFTAPQSCLRGWIDQNITVRKDCVSRRTKTVRVKPSAPDADEPRLYGQDFCPLLPEEKLYHGALGHFRRNPESGRTLYGTASSSTRTGGVHIAGLLAVMGFSLRPGRAARAHRAEIVRQALEAFHAVVGEAFGGVVAARHGETWLSLEDASQLSEDDLGRRVLWYFFLPENWRERRAADIEAHHAERHARGATPFSIRVTEDRALAARAHSEHVEELYEGNEGLPPEPLRIRLRAARKARKLSQGVVGRIFGVSHVTVGKWEAGAETDEKTRKPKGKPIPPELVPLVLRWVEEGMAPTAEELAKRKTRRDGVSKSP